MAKELARVGKPTEDEKVEKAVAMAASTVGLCHGNGWDETTARLNAKSDIGMVYANNPAVKAAIDEAIELHYGEKDPEPEIDDSVKYCPDCERPNQFGERCPSCIREEWDALRAAQVDEDERSGI